MDFKQIQELIKMINKSNIGEVTIEEKGFKITVKQKEEHIQQVVAAPYAAQPMCGQRRIRNSTGKILTGIFLMPMDGKM